MNEVTAIYQFGEFRLDTAKETLEHNGSALALTKKMFDTLLVLVENPDRIVTKRELMEKVWHDRFVEDSNLTFNIKMLRKALGDNAMDPVYIQTVPRRGYRFIAEVRNIEAKTDPAVELSTDPALERRPNDDDKRYTPAVVLASALVLVSAVFATVVWQQRAATRAPLFPSGFRLTRISDTGTVYNAVISPDGKYVAYTTIVNGMQSLWLRHLETASNTIILPPSDDIYLGLAFSPAGDALYFVRRKDASIDTDPAAIYRIPVFGGVPAKIVEQTQGWISVSPDDGLIAFVRNYGAAGTDSRLFVIGTDGTGERELKASEGNNYFSANSFSPDGRSIAVAYGYSSNAAQGDGLVEVNVETGEAREITSRKFFYIKGIEWLPDSRGLIFSADERIGNPVRIWHVDRASGRVDSITNDLTNFASLSLSRDADQLLTTSFRPDFQLSVQDPANPSGFTVLTQARDRFAFTPDGKIVFASDMAGNEDIWIMDGNGGNQRQLTNDDGLDFFPIVSGDGRYVYFTSNRTGESQTWRMNIDGSDQTQITRDHGGHPIFATADGRFVYYQSAFSERLMKVSVESGDESRVEGETGFFQSISPDGNLLAFFYRVSGAEARKLKVVELASGREVGVFAVPEGSGMAYYLRWQDNDKVAYAMNASDGEDSIWIQELGKDTPRILHRLPSGGIKDFQFTPDGRQIGVIRGSWKHDAVLLSRR